MDFIITFFRDVLDGPLYIGITVICGILICSCIGYLGEQYLNKKKAKEEYDSTHTAIVNDGNVENTVVSSVAPAAVPVSAVTNDDSAGPLIK